MTTTLDDIRVEDLPAGLGGVRPLELPATRYRQGGRIHYHVTIPLVEITRLVQRPDPNRPLQGNRKVDAIRAKRFAEYLVRNEDWVSPAILLKVPVHDVQFVEKVPMADGTAWGVLLISPDVLSEILLLDGQHRTLGVFISLEMINERLKRIRDTIQKLERNAGEKKALAAERLAEREALAVRHRLSTEHVSVDLVEVSDLKARQLFGDVNNNARGVSADLRTMLDQRDPVNRIAVHLIAKHPLLKGRVEEGQGGRMSAANTNLIGAKSVSDLVRAVLVGMGGRVTTRQAAEIADREAEARREVQTFLDTLVDSFDVFVDVMKGRIDGKTLRARSMLGSATMLRILANVYRVLLHGDDDEMIEPMPPEEIAAFFSDLEVHLAKVPVYDRLWLDTGAFVEGSTAPMGRQGSMKKLSDALVSWAQYGIPNGDGGAAQADDDDVDAA